MAVWKSAKSRRRSTKRRGTRVTRRAGAFGLLRGTRFAGLRTAARRYALSKRVPRTPFPDTKYVRHKYVDYFNLAAPGGAGIGQTYVFRANSMYDPDQTSTGHRPMFSGEMSDQYKNYVVLSSTIKIEFADTDNVDTVYSLWLDSDTTIPSSATMIQEQHGSLVARCGKRNGNVVLKGWYDAAKYNKTSRATILGDQDNRTANNANPATPMAKFFILRTEPLAGTNQTLNQRYGRVTMYFTTAWLDPKDHAGS